MQHDYYVRLMQAESRDLADFLATLSAADWETPSLCLGWRVRDVISHMAVGHTMPVFAFGAAVARHRFRVDSTSYALATRYAEAHSTEAILAAFRQGTAGTPKAATRFVPAHELFTDHLVHHQDIRRPLGRPREIPADRALAALRALPRLSGRVGSRRRMAGLRIAATDVPFVSGTGSLVVGGSAEALVMALTGRAQALSELSGTGVQTLAARLEQPSFAADVRPGAPQRSPRLSS